MIKLLLSLYLLPRLALLGVYAPAAQQLVTAHAENFRQNGYHRQIRVALVALPAADRLVGDVELFGKLFLRKPVCLAQGGYEAADGFLFHLFSPQ